MKSLFADYLNIKFIFNNFSYQKKTLKAIFISPIYIFNYKQPYLVFNSNFNINFKVYFHLLL